jgi:hypothetical protein
MASVAQEESRKTSERVKWGMYRQMERGYVMSNGVYGYHLNKGVLTVNEEEAQVVRLIFQKYLREHKGFKAIAKELIMSNISSGKRMREWNQKNIERILKNEKYIGDLLQKKTCTPNFLTHRSVINDGHEEKIYIRDNHDPIIDRDTWELTQIELKRRGLLKEEARGYSNRYWASGLLVCGECRTSVISRNKYNEDGSITRFWYCKNGYQYGKKKDIGNGKFLGCDSNLINDKALLTCVRYAVKEIGITSDELLSEIEKKLKQVQREESSSNLNGHRARIKTVREKKNNLIDHFMDGTLTKSDLKEMKERYDREIEVLEAKISREELELATFRVSKQKIGDILDRIRDIAAQEEPTKELYRDIIDRIILYNGHNIDIYFKFINSPVSLHYETIGRKSTYTTLCTLRKEEVV